MLMFGPIPLLDVYLFNKFTVRDTITIVLDVLIVILIIFNLALVYLMHLRSMKSNAVLPYDGKTYNMILNQTHDLELQQRLGSGHFSEVYKGSLTEKLTHVQQVVAIKMIKLSYVSVAEIDRELSILTVLKCKNIVAYYGMFNSASGTMLVFELAEQGDLHSYLNALYKGISPNEVINVLKDRCHDFISFTLQLLDALKYLETCKVVHRDLAARNVLLTESGAKLSDFGLSRYLYTKDCYAMSNDGMLAVRWLAPESIVHRVFSHKSDIYSFAVIVWEMFTLGATPYGYIKAEAVEEAIVRGFHLRRTDGFPLRVYSILQKCWHRKPADRPSCLELIDYFNLYS